MRQNQIGIILFLLGIAISTIGIVRLFAASIVLWKNAGRAASAGREMPAAPTEETLAAKCVKD